jgi:hypothetical protein
MSLTQPKRLSYTRRDLLSYHADVSRYIKEFIPRIIDTSEMNTGRLYLTVIEALVDNANFAIDQVHNEGLWSEARQRKNILRAAGLIGYTPSPVSAASVDLTFSMLTGVAPSGGQSIPIFTRCQTTVSPIVEFITVEAGVILEGETDTDIQAVQGIRVAGEVLTGSADGEPNQSYKLANAKTPHIFVEVRVNGVLWTRVDDFADADEESQQYVASFDEDDFTTITFGDQEFGKAPDVGASIEVDYIQTVADLGNAGATTVSRIVGSLASDVGVNNAEDASGGAASESNDSIRRNAPASRRSFERAVTKPDYEATSTAVAGVFKAFAIRSEGARTDIYLLPEGGGVASSFLVDLVQQEVDEKKVEGAVPIVSALQPASIQIHVNVVTFDSRTQKSTVKQKVRTATTENLLYTKLIRGRAFTRSDLSNIYENIDEGGLVDYVDYSILTRVPRVTKSNPTSPDFVGRVAIASNVSYDTYLVTAITGTTFQVSKNGAPQTIIGTVATEYSTDDGEVTFTLGESGDTFSAGDTWLFRTSEYVDNIVIDDNEFQRLEESTDLVVAVYYPDEYSLSTKSAA